MAKKSEIRQICDEAIAKVTKRRVSDLYCFNDRNKKVRRLKYWTVRGSDNKQIKKIQKQLNKQSKYQFVVGQNMGYGRYGGLTIHVVSGEDR